MTPPMSGVRVVDLSEGYEGYVGMMLAEFGAEVVKVEPPEGDSLRLLGPPFIHGESAAFMGVNRGKRSIVLDWRGQPAARALLDRLVAQADVVFTTSYPDDAEADCIRYEDLRTLNPEMIYCSLSPMGDTGPEANYRASDLEMQGMFGHWRYLGEPKFHRTAEPPLRLGVPVSAMNSAVFAFQGLTAALIHRARTGQGQKVSVSEAASLIAMKNIQFAAESEPDEYEGHNVGHLKGPMVGTPTKDRPIYWGFSGAEEALVKFVQDLGLDHLLGDASSRVELSGELKERIEERFRDLPAEEAMQFIRTNGGAAVYFNTFQGVAQDEQVKAMGMVASFEHPVAGHLGTPGLPWSFSESSPVLGTPPVLGQHTTEILTALGLSASEIEALAADQSIYQWAQ